MASSSSESELPLVSMIITRIFFLRFLQRTYKTKLGLCNGITCTTTYPYILHTFIIYTYYQEYYLYRQENVLCTWKSPKMSYSLLILQFFKAFMFCPKVQFLKTFYFTWKIVKLYYSLAKYSKTKSIWRVIVKILIHLENSSNRIIH